jgi:hypothetical protein
MNKNKLRSSVALFGGACSTRHVRLVLAILLVATGAVRADQEHPSVGMELAWSTDDNVNRSPGYYTPLLSDSIYSVAITSDIRRARGPHARLTLRPRLAYDHFATYSGLSNLALGLGIRYQYRPQAGFFATTYGLDGDFKLENYQSSMRSGIKVSLGGSARKYLTDRMIGFTALGVNIRNSNSIVYDTIDFSLRGNIDYLLSRRSTLYFTVDLRQGDIVAAADPSTPYASWIATYSQAIQTDDVFTSLAAYRLDASTQLYTIGFNRMLNEKNALDFSWRTIQSKATGGATYSINQIGAAYMWRF